MSHLGPPARLATRTPGTRALLVAVFFVACTVIALETVAFQTVVFVNDYLAAMQVISIALLGVACGGLVSYFVSPLKSVATAQAILLTLFPISVLISLPIIARLNATPFVMMALLSLPYVIASVFISTVFNAERPGRVYLYDLAGAGLGAVVVVATVPPLREEGSFFVLTALAAIPLLVFAGAKLAGARRTAFTALGAIAALIGLSLTVAHLAADPFNLLYYAKVDPKEHPEKVFESVQQERMKILYSRGSLVERIDIGQRIDVTKPGKKEIGRIVSIYNARVVDSISRRRVTEKGRLDNRMPTRLKLGQNPDTLLVGPSGQGLTKAIQTLGDGHIDAVEINEAIAHLMTDELYERSGRAYKGMDLTVGDVRSFIARTDRKYDFITLLNTHRIWSIGHTGAPEYCHSLEAMRQYFSHLKDDGFVLFEERNINVQADWGIKRILKTAMEILRERGAANPERHVAIWELWHHCSKAQWIKGRCDRGQLFTFLMLKATPITPAEEEHLLAWEKMISDRYTASSRGQYAAITWRYLPGRQGDNDWTGAVKAASLYDTKGADRAKLNLGAITDDRPYPFDIFEARAPQWRVFSRVAFLSLLMVLLPAIVTFFARRDRAERASRAGRLGTNVLFVLYFAVLGIGYLLIEIVLMQKFAIFLGSPVTALVIVLGIMLLSSGLGGLFSERVQRRGALLALGAVVALTLLVFGAYGTVLDALIFLPFPVRVIGAVALIAPLGFAMGVPFPYAMAAAKRELSERHAGLLFGINGALGAMASSMALILSLIHGFGVTILAGGGAYLVCLVLLAAIRETGSKAPGRE